MWLYILALLILLITYYSYKWVIVPIKLCNHYQNLFKLKGYTTLKKPYRPYSAPLFQEMINDQTTKGDALIRHKNEYVPVSVIITNALTSPDIVLMNPDLIKEMTSPEKFILMEKEKDIFQVFFTILSRGMLVSEGIDWKNKRKVLSNVFNYDFITAHIPMMAKIADNVFNDFQNKYWSQHPEQKQKGQFKVELKKVLAKYTSSIVISGFLGMDSLKDKFKDEPVSDCIMRLTVLALDLSNEPMVLIFGERLVNRGWKASHRQFTTLRKDVDNLLKNYISNLEQTNQDNSKEKSIVKLLLQERKKGSHNFEISSEYLMDQIKTFVIAGTDTTTTFVTSMICSVFQKTEVAQKLRAQINSVIKSDDDITVANFKKMPYLECVINQTSRKMCSVPGLFTRKLSQDTTIGGVPIKKGTMIDTVWMNMMYNPDTFDQPHEFIPQRWQKEQNNKYQHLLSMIFSGGPRGCLGKNLSLTEMKVFMIKFMQRYDTLVELNLKQRAYEIGITYFIKDSNCLITKRQ